MDNTLEKSDVAVVLPCFNEQETIAKVIRSFRACLPDAVIYVFDNNSTDNTADEAAKAGAQVYKVQRRGKGNVVRAIFRDVDADYYIMADGDGTYSARKAPDMLNIARTSKADMVVGNRLPAYAGSQSRSGHQWGNCLLTRTVNYLFQSDIQDLLSGYRVMSRRFVKSLPLFSAGFEVETTISLHAIEVDARVHEIPVDYYPRPEGSHSKLHTFRDGARIVWEIISLYKDQKPKTVYGILAALFFLAGLTVGVPVIAEYFQTRLVPRFPSAILASGLCVLGFLCTFAGIILSAIAKNRREIKKLSFLAIT